MSETSTLISCTGKITRAELAQEPRSRSSPFLMLANLLLAERTSTISDHSPESPHSGLMQRLNTLVVNVSERVSVRWTQGAKPYCLRQDQEFSTRHTFLGPSASAIANIRPFGDGTACQIS